MSSQPPALLGLVRRALRYVNAQIGSAYREAGPEPFNPEILSKAEEALKTLPLPDDGARAYLAKHVPRLARTLALAPAAQKDGARVLELGCYMQITPFLNRLLGYREVIGGYYGPAGKRDHKTIAFPDGEFSCAVDCFDAERDVFTYPDGHFDLAIAGEMIEHLLFDPMWMLLESRRVLREGGSLLITTPNVGSIASVAKTLDGRDNPQIYFLYKRPAPGAEPEVGHMREYTVHELGEIVKAAGFEVRELFTTHLEYFATHRPLLKLLEENGYDTRNRGEQSWCLAVKNSNLPVDRFPWFVYEQ